MGDWWDNVEWSDFVPGEGVSSGIASMGGIAGALGAGGPQAMTAFANKLADTQNMEISRKWEAFQQQQEQAYQLRRDASARRHDAAMKAEDRKAAKSLELGRQTFAKSERLAGEAFSAAQREDVQAEGRDVATTAHGRSQEGMSDQQRADVQWIATGRQTHELAMVDAQTDAQRSLLQEKFNLETKQVTDRTIKNLTQVITNPSPTVLDQLKTLPGFTDDQALSNPAAVAQAYIAKFGLDAGNRLVLAGGQANIISGQAQRQVMDELGIPPDATIQEVQEVSAQVRRNESQMKGFGVTLAALSQEVNAIGNPRNTPKDKAVAVEMLAPKIEAIREQIGRMDDDPTYGRHLHQDPHNRFSSQAAIYKALDGQLQLLRGTFDNVRTMVNDHQAQMHVWKKDGSAATWPAWGTHQSQAEFDQAMQAVEGLPDAEHVDKVQAMLLKIDKDKLIRDQLSPEHRAIVAKLKEMGTDAYGMTEQLAAMRKAGPGTPEFVAMGERLDALNTTELSRLTDLTSGAVVTRKNATAFSGAMEPLIPENNSLRGLGINKAMQKLLQETHMDPTTGEVDLIGLHANPVLISTLAKGYMPDPGKTPVSMESAFEQGIAEMEALNLPPALARKVRSTMEVMTNQLSHQIIGTAQVAPLIHSVKPIKPKPTLSVTGLEDFGDNLMSIAMPEDTQLAGLMVGGQVTERTITDLFKGSTVYAEKLDDEIGRNLQLGHAPDSFTGGAWSKFTGVQQTQFYRDWKALSPAERAEYATPQQRLDAILELSPEEASSIGPDAMRATEFLNRDDIKKDRWGLWTGDEIDPNWVTRLTAGINRPDPQKLHPLPGPSIGTITDKLANLDAEVMRLTSKAAAPGFKGYAGRLREGGDVLPISTVVIGTEIERLKEQRALLQLQLDARQPSGRVTKRRPLDLLAAIIGGLNPGMSSGSNWKGEDIATLGKELTGAYMSQDAIVGTADNMKGLVWNKLEGINDKYGNKPVPDAVMIDALYEQIENAIAPMYFNSLSSRGVPAELQNATVNASIRLMDDVREAVSALAGNPELVTHKAAMAGSQLQVHLSNFGYDNLPAGTPEEVEMKALVLWSGMQSAGLMQGVLY